MKSLLFLSWLLIAVAGYYGYGFYQQALSDSQKSAEMLAAVRASNADLSAKIDTLTQQVSTLQTQLIEAEKKAASPTPAPVTTTAPPQTDAPIPTTITTIYGKSFTGCLLSRTTPDGISFTHSMGVAKVLFSELDPALAAKFGYDPVAAKKYEVDQAAQEAQSDAIRSVAEAAQRPADNPASAATANSATSATSAPVPAPRLSEGQRQSIQAQIAMLQEDIADMQKDEAKVYHGSSSDQLIINGDKVSHGAYSERIAKEQAEIAQLQQQLR